MTSFSSFPIRACTFAGVAFVTSALVAFAFALALLPQLGGGVLLLLSLIIGLAGVQLVAIGLVGEYVWRALEESRRRPPYLIEALAGQREAAKLQ